jgi:hypothetical protein
MMRISMRDIIQAREEASLVQLLLRRRRRGEDEDYVKEDNYLDTAVGGKLPGHYYLDVPVCQNCFRVYQIISEARSKAIAKLTARKAKAAEREQQQLLQRGGSVAAAAGGGRGQNRLMLDSLSQVPVGVRGQPTASALSMDLLASARRVSGTDILSNTKLTVIFCHL